jgi:hypothetical protein
MDDTCEYLWRLHAENMTLVRHVETQRSTIASVLVPLSSAILTVVAFQWKDGSDTVVRALACLVIFVGVIGVLFAAKLYEMYAVHIARARGFRKELSRRMPDANVEEIRQQKISVWRRETTYLRRLPVHALWLGPHLITLVIGIIVLMATFNR